MNTPSPRRQFSTFIVADQLYGIEVSQVQEVTQMLPITPVHLSANYVAGLMNLRGQIATAIGMRELFGFAPDTTKRMAVVSRTDGTLLSLLVDHIGDVIEVGDEANEDSPATVPESVKRFMSGVYKLPDSILSVIDMNKLMQFLISKG